MKTQNRVIAAIATVIVSAGLLTACGDGGHDAQPGDTVKETVYRYNGADLHCAIYMPATQYGMMSCDFVRYHAENGG